MTRIKSTSKRVSLKELVGEDSDFLKAMVGEVVHQVLESEMDACLQARKGELLAAVHLAVGGVNGRHFSLI